MPDSDQAYEESGRMGESDLDSAGRLRYRAWLTKTGHTASRDFDKAIMTLAGGTLALSVTFVRELVAQPTACSRPWIISSWVLLVISLMAILVSILTSQHALRKAVGQVDDRTIDDVSRPGGTLSALTEGLNITAAVAFVLGLVCLVVFASLNY